MTATTANTLTIRTPEGISFEIPLASPLLRFFAWGFDFIAIMVLAAIFEDLFGFLGRVAPDMVSALFIMMNFILYLGYAMLLEFFWNGQTLGKRLFSLRVMDSQGFKLQPSQIVLRNLLRTIDSLPVFYLIGGLVAFFHPLSQRLGDMAANTVVIHTRLPLAPDLDQLSSQKFNSLRRYPRLVARLRQKILPREAAIALQALLRRDEFAAQARVELFDELADHFKAKVVFPEDAMVGLSSEQFVRNVIETVFTV